MDSAPRRKPNYTPEIAVGMGYLLFFGAMIVACAAAVLVFSEEKPSRQAVAPTYPAPVTPTAHVLATPSSNQPGIFFDDFSEAGAPAYADWRKTDYSRLQDGKLVVANSQDDDSALVTCGTCLRELKPYYMQADFSTDVATAGLYGFVIRSRYGASDFYLFAISTEARQYFLYQLGYAGWSLRAGGISDAIRSFPAVNTLGVYAGGPILELYVNGTMIETYEETGTAFESGIIGFYADAVDFQLKVDNLIIDRSGGS